MCKVHSRAETYMCLGGFSERRLGVESQGGGCWRGGQLGSGCHLASRQLTLAGCPEVRAAASSQSGEEACGATSKVRRLQVVTLPKIHSLSQGRLGAGQGCCEIAANPAISLDFLRPP